MGKDKKKKRISTGVIANRRAKFDYELEDELRVGMSLDGRRVRAARDGHVSLQGAYVTARDGQLWLNGASFTLRMNTRGGEERAVDSSAVRLLATKEQIFAMEREKKDGMTVVPTKLLTKGRFIKLVVAVGKGKKKYDKRETIKRRDTEREHRRMLKKL
ncbi:SsrA-binding protein [Candidatus Saccharibacteria bacterium]|nr:SsrA-binding protein [Candidatus Saccharibacteria bacterium]